MRRLVLLAVFSALLPIAAASAQGYPGMSFRGNQGYDGRVPPGVAYSGSEYPRQAPYEDPRAAHYDYGRVQQDTYRGYGQGYENPQEFRGAQECRLPYARNEYRHPGGPHAYEEDTAMARSAQSRAMSQGGCQEWSNSRSGNRGVAWVSGRPFRDRSGRACQPVTEIVDVNGTTRRNEGGICH